MTEDEFEMEVLNSINSLIEKGFVKSSIVDGEIVYQLTEEGKQISQLLFTQTTNNTIN